MTGRVRRRRALAAMVLAAALSACEVPSLEDSRCTAAKVRVRQFYSTLFDRADAGSTGVDDAVRPFLSDRLAAELAADPERDEPYFTTGDTFPKSFRVGACRLRGDEAAELDVLLLWRTDDEKSFQREVIVGAAAKGGSWVIDSVSPR